MCTAFDFWETALTCNGCFDTEYYVNRAPQGPSRPQSRRLPGLAMPTNTFEATFLSISVMIFLRFLCKQTRVFMQE